MNENEYLEYIIKKLSEAIEASDSRIIENTKEISKMHDYYWENYNEFDEFGYEDFANRQMLETEVNLKADEMLKNRRYKKMIKSPYFGRIDFIYDGEDEAESFYIGIGNFQLKNGSAPLIYDWRAPISSLFYDYDKGPASFTAPVGIIDGEIVKKCQYKIKDGKMIFSFESDIKIDDDILKRELSFNADARLKSIVGTIQKEQNQIIRNESDRILVVQGGAGSGKTSIALHRIAYLLYHHRNDMKAANILIFSPNGVFADYISHILPELGEENILEMNFDTYVYKELKKYTSIEAEDKYDGIERILSMDNADDAKEYEDRINRMQSKDAVKDICGFVIEAEYDLVKIRDLKYKKIAKTADEIATLFYEKFPDIPVLARMDTIASYICDEESTLRGKDMEEFEEEIVKDRLKRMYRTTNLLELYNEYLVSCDEVPLERDIKYIPYEHVYPMLYLRYALMGAGRGRNMKHIIIDEMQDYSYMQYDLIKKIFGDCPMTILGDREQTMASMCENVTGYIREIFGKKSKIVEMKKSYRQTIEIASFAGKLIKSDNEYFERHGEEVGLYECINETELIDKMVENINKQSEFDTIAILCLTIEDALYLYEQLKTRMDVSIIDKESENFTTGVVITTFYIAKGLEFDAVHVYDTSDKRYYSDFHKQILYIESTRALHSLKLYSDGNMTELVK